MLKNKNSSSNRNFNINEFSNNYEKQRLFNTKTEMKGYSKDFDFTNSIEYLKLTNDFLDLEEKKSREKTNRKINSTYFKNPFIVDKGTSSEGDFNSFTQWKNNQFVNKQLENDIHINKIRKENMGPISEDKSDTSEMISYEDIYLMKSESNLNL
jgi:hypothetical protein